MPTITKKGFKKAFFKREMDIESILTEINEALEEHRALGIRHTQFDKDLEKLKDQVKKVVDNANGDYSKRVFKEAAKELKEFTTKAKKMLDRAKVLKDSDYIKIKGDQLPRGLHLHPGSIPGFTDLTPEEQQQTSEKISAKISSGKQLYDQLIKQDFDPSQGDPPTRESVSELVWYIRAMAERQVQEPWAKGACTIPDPGNRIRKYIDRCQGIYVRKSTHITEQPNDEVGNEQGGKSARGIDFYDGKDDLDLLLPYGMNTLLVQTVEAGNENNQRLYIKMETESALGSGGRRGEDAPREEDEPEKDLSKLLAHGVNMIGSDDKGMTNFRENTATEDVSAYKGLLKTVKNETALQILESKYRKRGTLDKLRKIQGNQIRICDMMEAFKEILECAEQEGIDQQTVALITKMQAKMKEKYPDGETRFGREVVLDQDTLSGKVDQKAQVKESREALQSISEYLLQRINIGTVNTTRDGFDDQEMKALINEAMGKRFAVANGEAEPVSLIRALKKLRPFVNESEIEDEFERKLGQLIKHANIVTQAIPS